MKIALKELRETSIWLRIIERKPLCETNQMTDTRAAEIDQLFFRLPLAFLALSQRHSD